MDIIQISTEEAERMRAYQRQEEWQSIVRFTCLWKMGHKGKAAALLAAEAWEDGFTQEIWDKVAVDEQTMYAELAYTADDEQRYDVLLHAMQGQIVLRV
jgi:hypothetical protein